MFQMSLSHNQRPPSFFQWPIYFTFAVPILFKLTRLRLANLHNRVPRHLRVDPWSALPRHRHVAMPASKTPCMASRPCIIGAPGGRNPRLGRVHLVNRLDLAFANHLAAEPFVGLPHRFAHFIGHRHSHLLTRDCTARFPALLHEKSASRLACEATRPSAGPRSPAPSPQSADPPAAAAQSAHPHTDTAASPLSSDTPAAHTTPSAHPAPTARSS